MKQLEGRVAAVTASTRGIGRACAEALAAEGALVYLAARSAERAAPAIEAIERAGGAARFVRYDAADEQSPAAMLEQITREAGRLDLLVNNFGYTDVERDRDVASGDPQVFFEILRRNIASVYLPVRAALPLLRVRGGSIVNISSVGGVLPDLSRLAYCVSKASINSLTQNLAVQLARDGIRCNAVLPGLTATDAAAQNLSEEFCASFVRHLPLGRIGRPEDIAAAVLFLASDSSGYITGALLEVAGGFGLPTPQYAEFAPPPRVR